MTHRWNRLALTALVVLPIAAVAVLPAALAAEGKGYGEPLTGTDTIAISELLAELILQGTHA